MNLFAPPIHRNSEPAKALKRVPQFLLAVCLLVILLAGGVSSAEAACVDLDGDGAGVGDTCPTPVDCDDADPNNFPGNPEVCDGADNDCANGVDDGLPTVDYYNDDDSDNFGGAFNTSVCSALQPPGTVTDNTDCDDADANNFPGNLEVCDLADNDCDAVADNGLPTNTYYFDNDADGAGGAVSTDECTAPPGTVDNNLDCDDADPYNSPFFVEVCDGADNDCDAIADNGLPTFDYYFDNDSDNFGGAFNTNVCSALQPPGTVTDNTDCDDADSNRFPGNPEVCDAVDNDCDLVIDDALICSVTAVPVPLLPPFGIAVLAVLLGVVGAGALWRVHRERRRS